MVMKNPTDNKTISIDTSLLNYEEVKRRIQGMLPAPVEFEDDQNLIELGLDSLRIMRLVNGWRRGGAKVTFAEMISSPRMGDWRRLLRTGNGNPAVPEESAEEPERRENATGPFPLTDVQHAYWIGRRDDQPLGGVGCHAYLEIDGENVEPQRLEEAWKQIVTHHSMLRARFREDGNQEIMEAPASTTVPVHDLRLRHEDEQNMELERIRDRLSHRRLHVEKGEVAGLELSLLSGNRTRLHFDIDLLVADVQSLQIILRDLAAAYGRGERPAAPSSWSFAAYLENEARLRFSDRQNAVQYWSKRLPSLPEAPGLPLKKAPETVQSPVFKRRKHCVRADRWKLLKKRSTAYGITPAMTLLTAYAEVLDRWSSESRFLINIPLFNRQTDQPGIEDVVADFTSLLLLAVDCSSPRSFIERAREIQAQFHKDVANSSYSGVQIQRDMARARRGEGMFAPVVFASNLGAPLINEEGRRTLGKLSYMISQTPQVWLDFQSYETDEGLLLAWDGVEELFPEGLLDQMFSAHIRLMDWLAEEENDWLSAPDMLPALRRRRRESGGEPLPSVPDQCLHAPFFDFAAKNPCRTALIDTRTDTVFSYGELAECALQIAAFLKETGVSEGEPVAVTLPRGMEQIAAVLGIEAAGACYAPVSIEQPADRRNRIHEQAGIRYVLGDGEKLRAADPPKDALVLDITDALRTPPLAEPVAASPSGPAYIIFTSGSTGQPKGVEISHAAAWNTIADINRRYGVGPDDRVLAVSALDFDLSVYDVFGILGAGGSLVLITEDTRRDAAHWLALLDRHRVTIWNSVPVLLDMLLIAAESSSSPPLPLRLAMLSGDWIGLDIPPRLKKAAEHCRLIAMGGATEASIWSNYCEVTLPLPRHWVSIPYGRPLSNQEYRVVDAKGRDCPDWVPGELWIGGAGVALGYRGDPELTAERFVSGEGTRWYRTGDLGRFWPDGDLEFLGRKDYQLKIRGHRIEPGEIEAAIKEHPGIRDAVVVAEGDTRGNKRLVAYVVPAREKDSPLFETESADPARAETLRTALLAAGTEEAGKLPEDADLRAFTGFWQGIENICPALMCNALNDMEVFTRADEKHSLDALMQRCGIRPGYRKLLGQWLEVLKEEGLLQREDADTYISPAPLPTGSGNGLWQEVDNFAGENEDARNLLQYFKRCAESHVDLLRGDINPLELYFPDGSWRTAESMYQSNPIAHYYNRIAAKLISVSGGAFPEAKPLRILELGAGTGGTTASLLPELSSEVTLYHYTDVTPFFAERAKIKFKDYPFIHYGLLDIDRDPRSQGYEPTSYHVIVAANVLHDARNIEKTLQYLRSLLVPGGLIFILEGTRNIRLQMISVGFIEGFSHFEDERVKDNLPLLSVEKWRKFLCAREFENFAAFPESNVIGQAFFEQHVMMAQAPFSVTSFKSDGLAGFLHQKLPDYMHPAIYIPLDGLPLTPNGKIDRKTLPSRKETNAKAERTITVPQTPVERSLADVWKRILEKDAIGTSDSFFELGGDSLLATKLCAEVRTRFKVELSLGSIFAGPTVAEQARHIQELMETGNETSAAAPDLPQVMPAPEERNLPFPLTDIQQAYWVGRSGAYALGNVATHCYFEIEGDDLDLVRVGRAWQRLIDHHEMMKAVILPDGGRQKILDEVPLYRIRTRDMRKRAPEEAQAELSAIREEMSHQVLSTDQWPLFDVRATRFGENRTRIHVSFDNLIFDGWSMIHLLNEWSRLYRAPDASLPDLELSFRDYVLALEKLHGSERYERDRDYWFERLPDLPPAPELPLAHPPDTLERQRFSRMEFTLHRDKWRRLKKRAARLNLTPSGILLAAFAEVLGLWSKNPRFTINLTLFNRLPLHPQVNRIIGDFTSLTLLAVDLSSGSSFLQRAENLQQQLWRDLDHPHISGVRVLRELGRLNNDRRGAVMPVVFTSALGVEHTHDGLSGMDLLGDIVYNITQTPQVWLDHQVMEQRGDLVLVWDSVQGLFPEGLLAAMFEAYRALVTSLADDEEVWQKKRFTLMPYSQTEKREQSNKTEEPLSPELLHTLFTARASEQGEKAAIITSNRTLTYRRLFNLSNNLAAVLHEKGARPDTLVAVVMEKGWEQVVAVMGILLSGAAYVPIDPSLPDERRLYLLKDAEVSLALTQSRLEESLVWPEDFKRLSVDLMEEKEGGAPPHTVPNPGNLAYVIYTSGSTGVPKGVMIDHRGAVNTIRDVNRRFQVGPDDRVLALSSLSFDLSVYDIFGILAAGGALVVPDAHGIKDPAHWLELMRRERVTLWNSAPALMQMLVEYASGRNESLPSSLRLALLSGDWIPPDLPDRIRALATDSRIVSLGGATEASIWSILYPIDEVDPSWKSIPYGRPMANQRFHILNEFMEDCPDWVPGQIYIAGTGLALGYWKDEGKTSAAFITHPKTGERLYRTGDLGRYLPNGDIEFLGREDFQVKIRGHRIELGEIEAALKSHPLVRDAVVAALGDNGKEKRLVGYVVPKNERPLTTAELTGLLKKKLPEYCVLSALIFLDSLPLTANGKTDYKALPRPSEVSSDLSGDYVAPRTDTEKNIAAILQDVVDIKNVGIHDNFFDMGADSLHLVRFHKLLNDSFGRDIPLLSLFEHTSVGSLAEYLDQNSINQPTARSIQNRALVRKAARERRTGTQQ
jgi:yersiniabactin nonribosomal peptide synthetase